MKVIHTKWNPLSFWYVRWISTFNILIVFFFVVVAIADGIAAAVAAVIRVIRNPRVANNRLLRKPKRKSQENNYWEMTWNMKQSHLDDWWPKASIRIVTLVLECFFGLNFDEHNLFCKTLLQSSGLSRPPLLESTATTKSFNRWAESMGRRWRRKKNDSRAESVIMLRNAITYSKNICFWFLSPRSLARSIACFFFSECITWQLRAPTRCVKPFVTVVTNDSKV